MHDDIKARLGSLSESRLRKIKELSEAAHKLLTTDIRTLLTKLDGEENEKEQSARMEKGK